MGLNIRRVVYTDLPGQAKGVRGKGQELDKEVKKIYQSVEDMSKDWYGDRYNDLVDAFNNMVNDFNQIIDLLARELPSTLETIANNYSNVDRGQNITKVDNTAPAKLPKIPKSNKEGLHFIPEAVDSTKTTVNSSFNTVLECMKDLKNKVDHLSWESDASDKFREEYTKLQAKLEKSITEVKSKFDESAKKSLDDMAKAEKANLLG